MAGGAGGAHVGRVDVLLLPPRDGDVPERGERGRSTGGGALKFVVAIALIITLAFGVLPSPLIDQAKLSGGGVVMNIADADGR
jgi:hypothetical protein